MTITLAPISPVSQSSLNQHLSYTVPVSILSGPADLQELRRDEIR